MKNKKETYHRRLKIGLGSQAQLILCGYYLHKVITEDYCCDILGPTSSIILLKTQKENKNKYILLTASSDDYKLRICSKL